MAAWSELIQLSRPIRIIVIGYVVVIIGASSGVGLIKTLPKIADGVADRVRAKLLRRIGREDILHPRVAA